MKTNAETNERSKEVPFDGNAEELLNSSGEVTAAGLGVSSLTLHTCNGMPWG
jgi:hypothetical protein